MVNCIQSNVTYLLPPCSSPTIQVSKPDSNTTVLNRAPQTLITQTNPKGSLSYFQANPRLAQTNPVQTAQRTEEVDHSLPVYINDSLVTNSELSRFLNELGENWFTYHTTLSTPTIRQNDEMIFGEMQRRGIYFSCQQIEAFLDANHNTRLGEAADLHIRYEQYLRETRIGIRDLVRTYYPFTVGNITIPAPPRDAYARNFGNLRTHYSSLTQSRLCTSAPARRIGADTHIPSLWR